MKNHICKIFLIFVASLIFLNAQQIQAQERSNPIIVDDVITKLTFTSRISQSTEQINENLIKEIRRYKVDFILTTDDEIKIREAGGNDLLIETIRQNPSKKFENYQPMGQTNYISLDEIESKLANISKANKSLQKIDKELIEEIHNRKVSFILSSEDYEKLSQLGATELLTQAINDNTSEKIAYLLKESKSIYQTYIDNYKGNIEQRKIAIEAGKEFIELFSDVAAFKPQIDYLKKAIPKLEDWIKQSENPY